MNGVLLAAVALVAAIAQAGRPPARPEPPPLAAGTSSVSGRIVDADSGKPIEGVDVRLTSTQIETTTQEVHTRTGPRTTTTSSMRSGHRTTAVDGTFAFDTIAAGTYWMSVSHRAYVPSCHGSNTLPRVPCLAITVGDDQRKADADVTLHAGATVRGRVLSPDGRPMADAIVRAELEQTFAGVAGVTRTDAEGRFEITSLPPLTIVIRVDPAPLRPSWHQAIYYPGVVDRRDAVPLTIERGATVEIELHATETPTATVRTIIPHTPGVSLQRLMIANPDTKMLVNMKPSAEGVAIVTGLAEGRYVIAAKAQADTETLAGYQLVYLGSGEIDIPLTLQPTAVVTGRIESDRGGLPLIDGVSVEAHWVSGALRLDPMGPDMASVGPDGTFSIHGLFGRRQFRLFRLPDDWQVAAVRSERRDVTEGIDLDSGSTTNITIVISRR